MREWYRWEKLLLMGLLIPSQTRAHKHCSPNSPLRQQRKKKKKFLATTTTTQVYYCLIQISWCRLLQALRMGEPRPNHKEESCQSRSEALRKPENQSHLARPHSPMQSKYLKKQSFLLLLFSLSLSLDDTHYTASKGALEGSTTGTKRTVVNPVT